MGIIICLPIFRWQYTEILQKLFSKVTDIVESTVVSRFTYLIPLQDEFRRFFQSHFINEFIGRHAGYTLNFPVKCRTAHSKLVHKKLNVETVICDIGIDNSGKLVFKLLITYCGL